MALPIRILHVIGIMNRGGAENMIMNLYRNIDRTKIQFDFVENTNEHAAFDEEIQSLGGRIYHCPRYKGKNHFAYTKWWNDFFIAHAKEYPIVHGHLGSTAAIYLSIAKKYGAYTIAHSHSTGFGSMIYRLFAYPTRYVADHFFTCSRDAGVSRYGKKVGNNLSICQVLNNAIDTQKFVFTAEAKRQMRATLHISENMLVIGHVGRFVGAKNHLFLIDVFRRIHDKERNSVLLLVGDGELRPVIEQRIAEYGLTECVIFAGVQSDVHRFYQAMDVFVFPSIYEGLGIAAIESQAAGLPCCVADTLPNEVAVTDLLQFRPLEDGADQWAEWVFSRAKESRRDTLEAIRNAGYDISSTSVWLENFYRNVVTNHE